MRVLRIPIKELCSVRLFRGTKRTCYHMEAPRAAHGHHRSHRILIEVFAPVSAGNWANSKRKVLHHAKLTRAMTPELFATLLGKYLQEWMPEESEAREMHLSIPLVHSDVVPVAARYGFDFEEAHPGNVVMTLGRVVDGNKGKSIEMYAFLLCGCLKFRICNPP